MSTRPTIWLLVATNLLIPIALLIFATGFFPYKTFIPGRASFEDGGYYAQVADAPFDKIIFMVVDALRRSKSPIYKTTVELTSPVTSSIPETPDSNSPKGMPISFLALYSC